MLLKEELPIGFVYTLEILRPNRLGRVFARRWDLAGLPAALLRLLTRLVGTERVHNILPTEMRNHVLSVVFNAGVQVTTWFCLVFENNYTPVAGDTMAAFPAAAGEVTAYAEATRPAYNEATPSAGVITNSANPAVFTFNATKTLFGAALSSSSVKGGTTGVLGSAAKFAASRSVDSGDLGRLTASITLTST